MPKIVHVNRIIKNFFDIIEGEVKIYQMFKILVCANVWFSRFPDFKVEICIEFAVNQYRKLKIAQLNERSRLE